MLRKYLYRRRLKEFEGQLVDGLALIANAVRSGLSLQQAFELASIEIRGPFGEECAKIIADIKIGASMDTALRKLGERIRLDDLQIIVEAIIILREAGGNIVETLQTAVSVMRERQKIKGRIRVLTTQGVVQGIIIAAMPLFLLLVLYFFAPEFVAPLFTTPIGWVMIFAAVLLEGIGLFFIKRIALIKV